MAFYVGDSNNDPKKVINFFVGDPDNNPKKVIKAYVGDSDGNPQLFYYINNINGYITSSPYYMDDTGLFINYAGRNYYKKNSGPAYVGAYYNTSTNWTYPILVSQSQENVTYTTSYDSSVFNSSGSIDINGITWYYAGNSYSFPGDRVVTPTDKKMPSDAYNSLQDAVSALIYLIYS